MVIVNWNSNDKSSLITLSNDNLTITSTSSSWGSIRATIGHNQGKVYWEETMNNIGTSPTGVRGTFGVSNKMLDVNSWVGADSNSRSFLPSTTRKHPGSIVYGSTFTNGDVLGIALDLDIGTIEYFKNGISMGVAWDDVNALKSHDGFVYASSALAVSGASTTVNFGNTSFKYTMPIGFVAYNNNFLNKILLLQNEKSYSIEAINTNYETKMTSNTAPTPYVASAESSHSSGTFPPWKAFNGTDIGTQDVWISANGRLTSWIQIDYGKKMKINRLNLRSSNYANYSASSPKNFDILYSDDGINFKTAMTVKDQVNWGLSETREFTFKEVEGRFFRIDVKEANNTTYITIGEVLFGYELLILNQVPSNTEQNFIGYGMNSPVQVGEIFTNKNYILQDTVSENTEGLWTTKINRKPLSIKFN